MLGDSYVWGWRHKEKQRPCGLWGFRSTVWISWNLPAKTANQSKCLKALQGASEDNRGYILVQSPLGSPVSPHYGSLSEREHLPWFPLTSSGLLKGLCRWGWPPASSGQGKAPFLGTKLEGGWVHTGAQLPPIWSPMVIWSSQQHAFLPLLGAEWASHFTMVGESGKGEHVTDFRDIKPKRG